MSRRSGTLKAIRAAALVALAACGTEAPTPPATAVVIFAYESRFDAGCPAQADICYAGCAHHLAPAGLQVLVPLWGPDGVRMTEAGPGRWRAQLADVPTNVPLSVYVQDIQGCCVDPCNTGFQVTEDVFANGVRLTRVVRDGLPGGIAAAVQFVVQPDGSVQP